MMLLCWIPVNVTYIIMILGTLWIYLFIWLTLNEINFQQILTPLT